MSKEIPYGLVKVVQGKYKGIIGLYDNDYRNSAIIELGFMHLSSRYIKVFKNYIDDNITTDDLYNRKDCIMRAYRRELKGEDVEERENLLAEYILVESELSKRYFNARFNENKFGKKIFISHSSLDKPIVRLLATDLINQGFRVWLDEWEIKVGQSIPKEISKGLEDCDYIIVVLSENSVMSNWVENEWYSMYWDEVTDGRVIVLPIVIKDCEIPRLLRHKKYADFTQNYNDGLMEVINAIQ